MRLVRPVGTWLVEPSWAPRVVTPLHDVLTEAERRAVLASNPDSFLHVTSPPLAGPRPEDGDVQVQALRRLLAAGAYRRLPEPRAFVYRMTSPAGDEHTGVVAGVDLGGFADGRVLGHERVQEGRVEALARHSERVGMRSELVTLFHEADPVLAELTAEVVRHRPLLDFTDAGGVVQSVWRAGPEESAALAHRLEGARHYITDGHHRVAAALAAWRRHGEPPGRSVLCALYPQDQVSVHAFHRRVRGPVPVPELLGGLESAFDVRRAAGPVVDRGSIGLYAAGDWWLLVPRDPHRAPGVAGLDVTVLDERVLRPLLAVQDADPRLEFLPELDDLDRTLRACDEDGGVLFTLRAPALDDLVSVAERREVMSAKTTHVVPKPRTGVFLHEVAGASLASLSG